MNKEQLIDFFNKLQVYLQGNNQRLGQAFFNVLTDEYPTLAEKIRGSQIDPFYNNSKITEVIYDICDDKAIEHYHNSNIYTLLFKS